MTMHGIHVYIFYLFITPVLWHFEFSNHINSFLYQDRFYGLKHCLSNCCARLRLYGDLALPIHYNLGGFIAFKPFQPTGLESVLRLFAFPIGK